MAHIKSSDMIKNHLRKNGVVISEMTIGKSPFSKYFVAQSPNSNKKITFCESKLSYPFDESRTASRLINSKDKTYSFAKELEIHAPESIYVDSSNINHSILDEFLSKHDRVIVKPLNGCQSRGLTQDINDRKKLIKAIKAASVINTIAIVQEQVSGEELRFISLDGIVGYVMLRQKPFVIGDGQSTVSELIEKENLERSKINDTLVKYPNLDTVIPREVSRDQCVPKQNERFELGTGSMIRTGASIYDIFDDVHQSYIDIANKITDYFGNGILSVDIMIKDYKKPAQDDNYALIELNTSISIPMCYSCRDGKHIKLIEDYIGPKLLKSLAE